MTKSKPPSKKPKERGSDTILVYLGASEETVQALEELGVDKLPDENEGRSLLGEARDFITVLRTWKTRPPADTERRSLVDRFIRFHARAAVYIDRRRREVTGA